MAVLDESRYRGGPDRADPAAAIRPAGEAGDGHPTWTADDIAAYRDRWPVGARLSEAVLIGPQMVGKKGVMSYHQSKTKDMAHCPWTCALPAYALGMASDRAMHEAIAPLAGHLTFLATNGRTRSAKGLGTLIRESAVAASLTGLSAHGLRKSRATALTDAGATTRKFVARTGHKTLEEAER